MSIGYACINLNVWDSGMKSMIKKNFSKKRLEQCILNNLDSLDRIIDYNIENNIKIFRISSDLIPFGSHPINEYKWWEEYSDIFNKIGKKIKDNNIRVSMHPGQYTVLNSPKDNVVKNAIKDLEYHVRVLEALNTDISSKMVLHIGGVYGDKKNAIKRFKNNYKKLSDNIKDRLVIENDERCYSIDEVYNIGKELYIPVVFDNLHHEINPGKEKESQFKWIQKCKQTWKNKDGSQKIHYSQQSKNNKVGRHSKTIGVKAFVDFYDQLYEKNIDIMLEVKDKNLSAVKCINCTSKKLKRTVLEYEWARYKYLIMEHSTNSYKEIRSMFSERKNVSTINFYEKVEEALEKESRKGEQNNAILHVWGYFKNKASEKERKTFRSKHKRFMNGNMSLKAVKNHLKKLAIKYKIEYLTESYYFIKEI